MNHAFSIFFFCRHIQYTQGRVLLQGLWAHLLFGQDKRGIFGPSQAF